MVAKMRYDDEVRVRIMDSLYKEGALVPNLKQIQKLTGYNKNTIKASLEFLKKAGVLRGFEPYMSIKALGFKLMPISVTLRDFFKKKVQQQVLERVLKDPNIFSYSEVMGPGKWNVMTMHVYRDITEYQQDVREKYETDIEGYYDFIKERLRFYKTGESWKDMPPARAAINVLKSEKRLNR
jgi:DNA-binding Lrp family transcriptional regulator